MEKIKTKFTLLIGGVLDAADLIVMLKKDFGSIYPVKTLKYCKAMAELENAWNCLFIVENCENTELIEYLVEICGTEIYQSVPAKIKKVDVWSVKIVKPEQKNKVFYCDWYILNKPERGNFETYFHAIKEYLGGEVFITTQPENYNEAAIFVKEHPSDNIIFHSRSNDKYFTDKMKLCLKEITKKEVDEFIEKSIPKPTFKVPSFTEQDMCNFADFCASEYSYKGGKWYMYNLNETGRTEFQLSEILSEWRNINKK